MYAYALNRIEGRDLAVPARRVFSPTKKEFDRLEALGAAREATDDEVALERDVAKRNGQVFGDFSTETSSDDTSTGADTTSEAGNDGSNSDDQGSTDTGSNSDDQGSTDTGSDNAGGEGVPDSGAAGDPSGKPKGAKLKSTGKAKTSEGDLDV